MELKQLLASNILGGLPVNGLCEEKKGKIREETEGCNMSREQPLDLGKAANYLKSTKMYVHVAE